VNKIFCLSFFQIKATSQPPNNALLSIRQKQPVSQPMPVYNALLIQGQKYAPTPTGSNFNIQK